MRRPAVLCLLLTLLAAAAVLPALADTPVVGYIPPGVDYGWTSEADVEPGHVRAQGVVVSNLEPARSEACPADGCRYELVVVDPAALRATTVTGCDSPNHGVVDPAPEEAPLGSGARVLTGQGRVPASTDGAQRSPGPLSSGVGLLCFAATAGAAGVDGDDRAGPLAATQPAPVVLLQPAARPGR